MSYVALFLDLSLKVSVIFAAGGVAALALRNASASARHLSWTATVCAALLLPVAAIVTPPVTVGVLPSWEVGLWRVSPAGVTVARSAPRVSPEGGEVGPPSDRPVLAPAVGSQGNAGAVDGSASAVRNGASAKEEGLTHAAHGDRADLLTALVPLAWPAGVGLVLLLLAYERWRLWRLMGRTRRVDRGRLTEETARAARTLGVARGVTIHVAPFPAVPRTWGVLAPRLLLPTEAERWTPARLRAVLLHELAHVRRRDALTQSLAALACAVYWFHPMVWVAANSMRRDRERAADDLVLASGTSGATYAGHLVDLARSLSPAASPEFATASMLRRSQLSERIEAVLDAGRSRREPGEAAVGGTLLAGLVAVAGLVAASPPASSAGPPSTAIEVRAGLPGGRVAASPAGPPPATAAPDELPPCWRENGPRSLDVHTSLLYLEVTREDDECAATIRVHGRLEFDPEFTRVTGISRGGRVVIEERDASGIRRLELRPDARDRPAYEYRANGALVGTGEAAERELRARLLVLFRYGGLAAGRRASWLLESDGVERVVDEARASPPDPVASEYLEVALRSGRLEANLLSEIAETVRRGIGDDRSAAEVLAVLFESQPGVASGSARPALERAMASVGSDAEHVRLLRRMVAASPSDGATLVLALNSAATGVSTDAEMASFLRWAKRIAGEGLSAPGPSSAYRAAMGTIGSRVMRDRIAASVQRSDGVPPLPRR